MAVPDQPPYLRIAADIQRRIDSGELRVGDRVPSTRQIVDEWGVAMATATKALAALRQDGLVRTTSGSGTVVSERQPDRQRRTVRAASQSGLAGPTPHRERIVRTAITIADHEGRTAVSMRRVAAELGVGTMSLYRHVPDKDELVRLMADAAFGAEELPEPGPDGWRAKLELVARLQWKMYRRHPWLAPVLLNSLNRPPAVPAGMRHVDWELRALEGLGLDERTMLYLVVTLNGYTGGMAISRSMEVEAELDSEISSTDRHEAEGGLVADVFAAEGLGKLAQAATRVPDIGSLDELFEFGLQRQLDGVATFLEQT